MENTKERELSLEFLFEISARAGRRGTIAVHAEIAIQIACEIQFVYAVPLADVGYQIDSCGYRLIRYMPACRGSAVIGQLDPDRPAVICSVAAVPGSIRLIDILADIVAVDSVMSRSLAACEYISALFHCQIAGHVMYEYLVDLLAAPAGRHVFDHFLICYQAAITHSLRLPLHIFRHPLPLHLLHPSHRSHHRPSAI